MHEIGGMLSGLLHDFSQTSLTLWPPDPRMEGAFPTFSEVLLLRVGSTIPINRAFFAWVVWLLLTLSAASKFNRFSLTGLEDCTRSLS